MVVREEDVDEEQDPERRIEVHRHELLDAGPEHLDHDFVPVERRPVHLAQRGRAQRLGIEALKERLGARAVLLRDHVADDLHRQRRDAVGQRADLAEVRLGEDVGAGREHLRELDEGGPQRGDRRRQPPRTHAMRILGQPPRPADEHPAAPITEEGQDERTEAPEDDQGPHVNREW